ncbi:DUF2645 family protein [Providencia sp. Me31A]|uniref:DUF2645 family protein n=1 Tax=Providencia sp. Me31A TaxID=3392637 RepID=UPI003D265B9D
MKIALKIGEFLYFIFLLLLINILSTSDYEWMVGDGDVDNLCQLPLGGRYITEPILVLTPCILLFFFERNKKLRWFYILIVIIYITWSFFLRFTFC